MSYPYYYNYLLHYLNISGGSSKKEFVIHNNGVDKGLKFNRMS